MNRVCGQSSDQIGALTIDSLGPALISLAWPILCSAIAEVLDISVNVMWVGRELGEVSLAALSNASLLWGLLLVASFGVSMAGTVRIARRLGEGDLQGAKAAMATTLITSVAVSVLCILPMSVWAQFLLALVGTPAAARPQAVEYLRTLLLSVPLIYVNAAVMATLQAAGDSKTGLYFAVASVAIDATLNPLLIAGISPFPGLGIAGSAVATVASQLIRLIGLVVQVYRTAHPLRLVRTDLGLLRFDLVRVASLLRDGGPMAAQVLWASVEDILMISLVNRFGADVTAGYGVVVQLWNLIMMPAVALGVAITAIVARHIGAGHWAQVRSVTRVGLALGLLTTAMLVTLAEVLDTRIFGLFLPPGSPSLAFAVEINREATWSLALLGGYLIWVGVLRATGAVWTPLLISAGVLAVRFPVTTVFIGRWQMQAIWWSFPASAAATGIIAALHAYLRPSVRRPLE